MRRVGLCCLCAVLVVGCSSNEASNSRPNTTTNNSNMMPEPIELDDTLGLDVVLPTEQSSPGLQLAATDLVAGFAARKGAEPGDGHVITTLEEADAPQVVRVSLVEDAMIGPQSFRLQPRDFEQGRAGIEVVATTATGASYGIYTLLFDMGLRYIHPEEPSYAPPAQEDYALDPSAYADSPVQTPHYELRGFHEHTQHPTPPSDWYMRPGNDAFRRWARNYSRWLLRNRQNAMSFHMLKTVDVDSWIPYIKDIVEEAQGFGIKVGLVGSFADEQQNNFRYITDDDGEDAAQIEATIDQLMGAGFDFLVTQYGTSEFTKPADARAISWMNTTAAYLGENYPETEHFVWVHPPCELEADDGSNFWHLPLQADEEVGFWVHTTMYYTLDDPAPVYDCEEFTHQKMLVDEAGSTRRQVFFPETAWWLGFDNNMPLLLPITGHSREYDIQEALKDKPIIGHITFTSGREWTYWQYDHYLTQVTWDASISWEDYLDDLKPLYGSMGEPLMEALKAMTTEQVADFYETNPLIYFYLAGELPQDELGAKIGILARRPKRAYREILELSGQDYETWRSEDFDLLLDMKQRYEAVLGDLPPAPQELDSLQAKLQKELIEGLALYLLRIDHALALYGAVVAVRPWREELLAAEAQAREPDAMLRMMTELDAQARLEEAQMISAQARELIRSVAPVYRYPESILIDDKPESPTAYPYGYLEQTHDAYFWTRRDDQLERFIRRVFDESDDAWAEAEPDTLFYTDASRTRVLVPDDPAASVGLRGFIPQLLIGLDRYDADQNTLRAIFAEDFNKNFLPDEMTEQPIEGSLQGSDWSGMRDNIALVIYDNSDAEVGTLTMYEATLRLSFGNVDEIPSNLERGEIEGTVKSADLIAIMRSVAGIDEEGAGNLIKQIYDEETLPEDLPIHFSFRFMPAG